MKKFRKGFTLVELLIVIAILGTLSAAMSVSVMGSTAKAKAVAIASNVEACVNAAAMYCADNMDADISSATTENVLSAYIGKWGDFGDENSVKYEAKDITSDTLSQENAKSVVATGEGVFYVLLWNGKVSSTEPTGA